MALPAFGGPVSFILDVEPLAGLISPDIDGLYASKSSSHSYKKEEIKGTGSLIPSLKVGLGINSNQGLINRIRKAERRPKSDL